MSRPLEGHVVAVALGLLAACTDAAAPRVEITGHTGECGLCHVDEWSDTRAPRHADAHLGPQCADCHGTERWAPAAGFTHSPAFALILGHGNLACERCHAQGFERQTQPSTCLACHASERARADALVPGHAGNPGDCGSCHGLDSFARAGK
jgi:hypothetical protein